MEEKKNSAIEFWRFIFCIALAIGHLNMIVWNKGDVNLLFKGHYFVAFFIFLSGYFLMANYQKNKSKNTKETAITKAWNYTKKRILALFPALFMGVALAFVVRNVIVDTPVHELFTVFMNSIWEFLGLSALGVTNLWNEPLIYISAIFIAGFILYYLINKSEELFKIITIITAIIVYSFGISNGWNGTDFLLGIPLPLIRIFAGMAIGALMYYPVAYLKAKKFSENVTMVFSIAHIALAMMILYIWFHGANFSELVYGLILLAFTFILLVNKDYIAILYNDNKFLNELGRLSLYYFVSHISFIYLLNFMFPEMGYVPSIAFNILFTLCWSYILMYIDDYLITPAFRSKAITENKPAIKKVTKKTTKKVTK